MRPRRAANGGCSFICRPIIRGRRRTPSSISCTAAGDDDRLAKRGLGRCRLGPALREEDRPHDRGDAQCEGRGPELERDLLDDVLPYVESHYPTRRDGQGRAIAGVSLGGGQALSIGLKHPDTFAWVGGFSPALAGMSESDLIGDAGAWNTRLKLLWISWARAIV